MEYILKTYGVFGALFIGGVWYLRHIIVTSSARQLSKITEAEKSQYANLLEKFKAELNLKVELSKIRFSSVYERKVNALLDLYSKLQEYEYSIGKISEHFSNGEADNYTDLYALYEKNRESLLLFFYKNSALFEPDIVSQFYEYKIKIITAYSNTYRNILKGSIESSAITHLEFELYSGGLSKSIKEEIKNTLNNC